ncbi:hypothetical protein B0H13DRAFT_1854971 [Mycena leptocephala]|nr:hypothetical protein B0H13DRAFT_1854971 [Mycena leptocephala]
MWHNLAMYGKDHLFNWHFEYPKNDGESFKHAPSHGQGGIKNFRSLSLISELDANEEQIPVPAVVEEEEITLGDFSLPLKKATKHDPTKTENPERITQYQWPTDVHDIQNTVNPHYEEIGVPADSGGRIPDNVGWTCGHKVTNFEKQRLAAPTRDAFQFRSLTRRSEGLEDEDVCASLPSNILGAMTSWS